MKSNAGKTYTKSQVIEILEREMHSISENKNRYIELNGYTHKDTLNSFAAQVAEVLHIMHLFD